MASTLRVFPCPNCRETINNLAQQCPFCGTPVDAAAAELAADALSRINQACSDASYLRVMGTCSAGFFLLRYVPFLGGIGNIGFLGLLVAVPAMSLRWWARFAGLPTTDAEYVRARRNVLLIGCVSLILLLAGVALVIAFIFRGLKAR
jgi:hypothetical protein